METMFLIVQQLLSAAFKVLSIEDIAYRYFGLRLKKNFLDAYRKTLRHSLSLSTAGNLAYR